MASSVGPVGGLLVVVARLEHRRRSRVVFDGRFIVVFVGNLEVTDGPVALDEARWRRRVVRDDRRHPRVPLNVHDQRTEGTRPTGALH